MDPFNFKRIADPVYGTIGLSELEVQVINTRAFLRLRNVKQLGLAHYVFPGVDYSRFAHSLGCCHVAGRILDSIRRTDPAAKISDSDIQRYRLAGLLHDIGHYPFSHAMEEAIKDFYSGGILEDSEGTDTEDHDASIFKHERAGREVLDQDRELNRLLSGKDHRPESIWSIFMREDPNIRFANLVSSDLDSDRIDYLLRTAHHSGLPYGSVDLDYIISQMRLDADSNICISPKALRAADHLLLCRYFDYLQVSFHKTVAGFELVLKDVIGALLKEGRLRCSRTDVTSMISNDEWFEFDDTSLVQKIRLYAEESTDRTGKLKARSILDRTPPRLVYKKESLANREEDHGRELYQQSKRLLEAKRDEWANEFGIEADRWYVWPRVMELTKVGSHEPIGADEETKKKSEIAAKVLTNEESLESEIITTIPQSLMKIMSNYANFMLRLYVLLTPEEQEKRSEIEARVKKDLAG
ncbi:HD domain-containing protein [Candidatus Micrarchaeota archaeon]|nr:HD domain-containing protein [Candidatus Micrarchaeota archaeon]